TASTTLLVNVEPPASLAATAGNGQVALAWPGSGRAKGYHVKRANVSGGPYVTVACPTTTSYVDTGVTNGTPYYYVVSAWFSGNPNAGGESADSSEASATPQPPPPPAPTSYQVKSATVSGGPDSVITSTTSTSYTNTGLTNGTTYYYVVSAMNGEGEHQLGPSERDPSGFAAARSDGPRGDARRPPGSLVQEKRDLGHASAWTLTAQKTIASL